MSIDAWALHRPIATFGPERMFTDYQAYTKFSRTIRNSNRYALDVHSQDFLRIFRENVHHRETTVVAGTTLVRAVRDYDEILGEHGEVVNVTGSSEDRVLPKKAFSIEGRVNPSGVVTLYLASSQVTAVSEARPWVGETISIAWLSMTRDLRLADLSKGHNKSPFSELSFNELLGETPIPEEKANQCVWNDIDSAFSQPTTRTDTGAEYAPTQILSEILKCEGFDGIVYKSSFGGEHGYNVALFNVADAKVMGCNAFSIDKIEISFSQAGNAWYKADDN
ncbi:MAG: hypothetical protein CML99_07150 [Rhodobiaceae bacterium]|nr:hypothetical protein [Rhodobiaceae bacterium]